MDAFVYNANPGRVIFGAGTLSRLPAEVERLGLARVLVLATPVQESSAQELSRQIGARSAGVFADARMHTPVEVTERAMAVVAERRVDGLVAVGGGSTTGLAKALALRTDLPQIVAPTTYAGSEMTPILGETQGGRKVTQSSPKILPEVVIYDVDLTFTLPVPQSVTSGMNAIAHAVEALYTREANPLISLLAESGIGGFRARTATHRRRSSRSRGAFRRAVWRVALWNLPRHGRHGAAPQALPHSRRMFDLPHAETHTAVLPHAVAYNRPATPAAMQAVARAMGVEDPAAGLYDLAKSLGATMALRDLGMPQSGIAQATEAALANPYWNPRPLEKEAIRALLRSAYEGARPV